MKAVKSLISPNDLASDCTENLMLCFVGICSFSALKSPPSLMHAVMDVQDSLSVDSKRRT